MKKSVDFSKGVRGKHLGMSLNIMGSAETKWAVCLAKDEKALIPFKLYQIEIFSNSEEISVKNEKGKTVYLPKSLFAIVEISKKTSGLLEQAA
ncbi:MAG TPA: hypothetical protein VK612_11255 [Pyrinomonadaceae bacterium]|nr:hypothetical protein [Pyrinomonadaceae bacterium]